MERKTMIKNIRCVMMIVLTLCPLSLMAQNSSIVAKYIDSLNVAKNTTRTVGDTSPYLFQMFYPNTYYSDAAKNVFRLDRGNTDIPVSYYLMKLYANRPSAVSYHDNSMKAETLLEQTTSENSEDIKKVLDTAKDTPNEQIAEDIDIGLKVKRPNFWKFNGTFQLQFTQNYFSENWYKGGNNNGTMLAQINLKANYNDTKYVTWENTLDMRLGFVTTTSDTCHTFLTNNDKLQLNTKIGIKAIKSWNYTISGEAKTQFLPGYRNNNRLKFSAFCAPLDVSVSTGMDYKPSFKNGNTLSIAILPLSYKLRYVGSHDENIKKTNNFVGRHVRQDYGSRIELNSNITIVKNLKWKCRSYYFTSYEYAEAELENVFSFTFSKYISSEVNTLWRFDDNRPKKYYDDNLGYFQFKEFMTLGLKYSF